jgi:shikimate dehydrogenase
VHRPTSAKQQPPSRAAAAFAGLPAAAVRAALIGRGIGQSRTPHMHMAEGARLGLDYSYALLDFDDLALSDADAGSMIALARRHGLAGLNVTHPFKQAILPHLDELSPEAAAIGAVNTVTLRDGKAVGFNTDAWGFAESFRRRLADAPLSAVLLLGAGGGGKAVARALLELGARRIEIFDLEPGRAAGLATLLAAQAGSPRRAAAVEDPARAAPGVDGLVNATPMGMAKYPGMPIPAGALRRDLWVADIVYFPEETALVRAATALGCRTLPGGGMAIFQAVRAFELITGRSPDPDAMARHFGQGKRLRLRD